MPPSLPAYMMNEEEEILALLDEARSRLAAAQPGATEIKIRATRVRKVLSDRRKRERIFDDALFADPAWDILLGLYDDELRERRSYIKDACVVSSVPTTTALRWIAALERKGLIVRGEDCGDQRRVVLQLTATGRTGMETYFAAT